MKYFISGFLATFCMLIISDKMLTKKDSNKWAMVEQIHRFFILKTKESRNDNITKKTGISRS